ncbi:MFS general substrate transporter [Peniophora sp. CONT]|nr:MFS general substrate transporter [Peniophora sp. CONT]
MPDKPSLVIIILTNILSQTSNFIVVSSGPQYAAHLGGTNTFAGLIIGIPILTSGMALVPFVRLDRGLYKVPLLISCVAAVLGNVLYGLAYRANYLYLILIGRLVLGIAFTNFLYTKRFFSDRRVTGIRRRTTLASWLVIGQSVGFTVGPFVGGLLYKIGFANEVFNGFTSPGWLMAGVWLAFGLVTLLWFKEVPRHTPVDQALPLQHIAIQSDSANVKDSRAQSAEPSSKARSSIEITTRASDERSRPSPSPELEPHSYRPTRQQWAVIATMCWFAMTCFFVLGAWESFIPIYTLRAFDSSPFAAGNLIALGGLCTFPFMLANIRYSKRVQDRQILAVGSGVGLVGLLMTITLFAVDGMRFWSLFGCWFLVALGFNLASTVTLSLLSKQMPHHWNGRISLLIQYSNFSGRVSGAVWGGAGVSVGLKSYIGLQLALIGIGGVMFLTLWRELKAKKG